MTKSDIKSKLDRILPWILIFAGTVGIIAAFIITEDKAKLLEDPNYKPSCSLNPVVSCGSVMESEQAKAFGFPNPYIGLIGFPVLITLGVLLLANSKFKRFIWLGLNAGLLFGVGFVHWLFYQSVYDIQALCMYCIAVWIVIILSFWYVTLYNLRHKNIVLPKKIQPVEKFVQKHHLDILLFWYLTITVLILHHFWYYFGKNLPF